MTKFSIDVGIIGAGLAGLTCARYLRREGFTVSLFDKSRGIGGRLATRRIRAGDRDIRVDHGLPFLTIQGERTRFFIQNLLTENLVHAIDDRFYPCPDGMNSIAKFLARELEIRREFLVTRMIPTGDFWSIEGKEGESVTARAIVLAIPAPQAVTLLQASNLSNFLPELNSIEYDPCITVIAGYADSLPIPLLSADFRHIGAYENRTVFVLQSGADLSAKYLDSEDLEAVTGEIIARSGLPSPAWSQIHRWRYAVPRRGSGVACLHSIDPLPLVACGDWCLEGDPERAIETALTSGESAAIEIQRFLT
ncbi:FAD-dependent oxidoreductase [Pannus brasiliensis CCIBt3594]|uniref:FAD-dependent oxidoreductase n=1 Tax=Pannus brasiliensis CCIBt3594 TaxID=1427578 RepID=A0AAW9QZC1_9CHRO